MATLKRNITQAIADFDGVKAAIEESGVEVPYDTDTAEYGNLVRKAVGLNESAMNELRDDLKVLETVVAEKADAKNVYTKEEVNSLISIIDASAESVKYEIFSKPTTALVDYREKEIRILCTADTEFVKQIVGAKVDADNYYIGFKAYAPDDKIVSFKEDMAQTIADDTMYFFENNEFAGIDEYGRKYSVVWFAVAKYNAETDTWEYYGAKSTINNYIGWYYSVEWYDANGNKVASDTIRINLSNEDCHNNIEPFFMNGVVKGVAVNGTFLKMGNNVVNIPVADTETFGVIKSSNKENKIKVTVDGDMEVNNVNVNKLVQTDGETLTLDSGSSVI